MNKKTEVELHAFKSGLTACLCPTRAGRARAGRSGQPGRERGDTTSKKRRTGVFELFVRKNVNSGYKEIR